MKKFKLVAKSGSYQVDGVTKNRYKNVGALVVKDDGTMYLRMDATVNISAFRTDLTQDSVTIQVFPDTDEPRKENTQTQNYRPQYPQSHKPNPDQTYSDDDIPF